MSPVFLFAGLFFCPIVSKCILYTPIILFLKVITTNFTSANSKVDYSEYSTAFRSTKLVLQI